MAELALAHLGLDELRFVPTATSPHKPTPGGALALDNATRVGLVKVLLRALPAICKLETLEVDRGGTSYTADTLETLWEREPDKAWILLIGGDQLPDFPRWRRAERILELASVAVAPRPGFPTELPESLRPRLQEAWSGATGEVVWLPSSGLPWASSCQRELIREGIAAEGLLPEVMAAISAENLYRE